MKIFYQESKVDYSNYSFPYQVWAEIDDSESIDQALNQGFLPQSSNIEEDKHLFYLARSLRYKLSEFSWDKKRRYAQRRFNQKDYNTSIKPIIKTTEAIEHYWERANPWMTRSLGESYLSAERFRYIWNKPFLNTILEIKAKEELIAFALINKGESSSHYWYCFYNPNFDKESGLGIMTMRAVLEWAQETCQQFAYVGTCYGNKAAYKSKSAAGVEFWDGLQWNPNKSMLKDLQSKDDK